MHPHRNRRLALATSFALVALLPRTALSYPLDGFSAATVRRISCDLCDGRRLHIHPKRNPHPTGAGFPDVTVKSERLTGPYLAQLRRFMAKGMDS